MLPFPWWDGLVVVEAFSGRSASLRPDGTSGLKVQVGPASPGRREPVTSSVENIPRHIAVIGTNQRCRNLRFRPAGEDFAQRHFLASGGGQK